MRRGIVELSARQQRLQFALTHSISMEIPKTVRFVTPVLSDSCDCLDKGGHFEVRQAEVVPSQWDMTTMSLEMTGKAQEHRGAKEGNAAVLPPGIR
jgi:hypothetical protein